MVEVSIIMPVYNVEQYLERSLKSIMNQTYRDIEIILVNDGSKDSSGEICEEYKSKDSRFKVIHKKNEGSGLARNTGMQAATAEYIYFADPDDFVEATLIEDNLEIIKSNRADIVEFGFFEEIQTNDSLEIRASHVPEITNTLNQESFRKRFKEYHKFRPFSLWTKMYRKSFLTDNNIQFSDQKVGQDALFLIEVYKKLTCITFNPKPYYHYVEREGSAVTKYRAERTAYEYNIASSFENLIKSWDLVQDLEELVVQHYWRVLFIEMKYLNFKDCPLNFKEKKASLREWQNFKNLNSIVTSRNMKYLNNSFNKLLFALLLYKQFSFAIKVMGWRIKYL